MLVYNLVNVSPVSHHDLWASLHLNKTKFSKHLLQLSIKADFLIESKSL